MRRLPDYAKKYRNAKIEREDGVLHVALHDGAGGTMKWCESAHTELPFLFRDIEAATDTLIRDAHFSNNTVPGDGVQVIRTALLGMNRGRSYLLTGQHVTAAEALEWGLVTEVVPPGQEIERARKYAQDIAKKHPFVIRHTREVFTLELKRRLRAEMPLGLALEGLANGYGNWR